LAGGGRGVANEDGRVTAWHFDNTANLLQSTLADRDDVALHLGSRLAQQALSLSPENRRLQALVVSLVLTRSRMRTPWTESLPRGEGSAFDAALLAGGAVVSESLRDALATGQATTAVAGLEVMRSLANRHDLHGRGGRSAPLTAALNYPDQRVQFTAAMVIAETDPNGSFRGASRVVQVLARALESTDTPRVVVSGPKPERVSALAGLVSQSGFETRITSSGRDAFRIAAERGDVQLVVLDANVIRWSLSETVANLRADARTSGIPIAVVGDAMRIAAVERMLLRDPLMVYIQRPANLKGLRDQLNPFLRGLATEPLSAAERGELQRASIDLLVYLSDGRRSSVFDLRPAEAGLHSAIQVPELSNGAVYALAAIATPTAQDRLSTTVLQPDMSSGTRERAAALLAFHIQKHGVLLTKERVDEVRTAHADETSPGVKSSLASVLGALGPRASRIGQNLRAIPLPIPR
jgi:DNA-binding response OmpR family regulator